MHQEDELMLVKRHTRLSTAAVLPLRFSAADFARGARARETARVTVSPQFFKHELCTHFSSNLQIVP